MIVRGHLVVFVTVLLVAMSHAADGNAQKIMIYGGDGNATYLGCLSCSERESESVFNRFGPYGSRFFGLDSIHNPTSEYGHRYSTYSACNELALDPPVIIDDRGKFYGRLTLNRSHPQAIRARSTVEWLEKICGKEPRKRPAAPRSPNPQVDLL